MHQLPAFANMTMSVRRELCGVMVLEVVEQAGTVLLHHQQEVRPVESLSPGSFHLLGRSLVSTAARRRQTSGSRCSL